MTRRQSETPDHNDPWGYSTPDILSTIETAELTRESEHALDALIKIINVALKECTARQVEIWRAHTGITIDGTVEQAMNIESIARARGERPNSVRGAFERAQVRILSRILAQQLPPGQRASSIAALGVRLSATSPIEEAELALAMEAPEYRRGRLDTVAAENARVDANTERPNLKSSKGSATGAHRVRFGKWEDELPKGSKDVQGKEWERFHQRQLDRLNRSRRAAES